MMFSRKRTDVDVFFFSFYFCHTQPSSCKQSHMIRFFLFFFNKLYQGSLFQLWLSPFNVSFFKFRANCYTGENQSYPWTRWALAGTWPETCELFLNFFISNIQDIQSSSIQPAAKHSVPDPAPIRPVLSHFTLFQSVSSSQLVDVVLHMKLSNYPLDVLPLTPV